MLARRERLLLDELGSTISSCRGARCVRAATGLTVAASSPHGFDMALLVSSGAYLLSFDQWQETFDDPNEARALFVAALRGDVRLRIHRLSGRCWRWTAERLDDCGNWRQESTLSHPIWPFWRKPDIVYRRNAFV